jgi:serine/threonine protein kinase
MIGDGLLYLHSNNIIHLNLKPNNILIVNGTVKISDFKYAANFDENTLMRLKYYLSLI